MLTTSQCKHFLYWLIDWLTDITGREMCVCLSVCLSVCVNLGAQVITLETCNHAWRTWHLPQTTNTHFPTKITTLPEDSPNKALQTQKVLTGYFPVVNSPHMSAGLHRRGLLVFLDHSVEFIQLSCVVSKVPTLPVYFRPFTLGNPKSHFQQYYSYILQIIYVISETNKLLPPYPPHLKNITTLPCKM